MGKLFGHHLKKRGTAQKPPGIPVEDVDDEEGKERDGPSNYEGREHVKYKNPGFSKHEIRIPEDEPRMKSRVSKEEMHEMEDNYHMETPDQTHHTLAKKIKRARMGMDDPDQEDPKPILGNPVHNVPYRGEKDTTGEEEMGPNESQKDSLPKTHRKKMIVAVMKRKMKK